MKDVCSICQKPVQAHEAAHGATGNHWDCQDNERSKLLHMADMATVVNWYVQLGSSRAEATKRVLQEQRLIAMRKV